MPISANANSLSFDQATYSGDIGSQINVTVNYDFTDELMMFAWFDTYYNADVLRLVSYTQAPLAPGAFTDLSPEGTLVAPGHYENMGLGTGYLLNFISGSGEIGTFTFEIIGQITPGLSMTPCAQVICLTPYTGMDSPGFF